MGRYKYIRGDTTVHNCYTSIMIIMIKRFSSDPYVLILREKEIGSQSELIHSKELLFQPKILSGKN